MPRFEITFRDLALPEEPRRTEAVEAEDQAEAMTIGRRRAREGEEVVGLAPAARHDGSRRARGGRA